MSADLMDIVEAIEAVIVAVPSLGADRVDLGEYIPHVHAATPPWVRVGLPTGFVTDDAQTIGLYRRTVEIPVLIAAAGTASAPREQARGVLTLVDTVIAALEADRGLGGRVIDLHISGGSMGLVKGLPGLSVAVLSVRVYYDISAGL
jgi:hypothetical protein